MEFSSSRRTILWGNSKVSLPTHLVLGRSAKGSKEHWYASGCARFPEQVTQAMRCSTERTQACCRQTDEAMPGRAFPVENLTPATLRTRISPDEENANIYSYVVDSVNLADYALKQYGSGPNFSGDYITLCTCKHLMRTYLTPEQWTQTWIAGFTSRSASRGFAGQNWLVYLMKIGEAYCSHRDLVTEFRRTGRQSTLEAKAAHRWRNGDVFLPIQGIRDPFDPDQYRQPVKNHSHISNDGWKKDIRYRPWGRPAALGNPRCSFRWTNQLIRRTQPLPRGNPKSSLSWFLDNLEEAHLP